MSTPVPIHAPESPIDNDDPSTIELSGQAVADATAAALADLKEAYKDDPTLGEPLQHNDTSQDREWLQGKYPELVAAFPFHELDAAEPFPHDEPVLHDPNLGDDCLCSTCSMRLISEGMRDGTPAGTTAEHQPRPLRSQESREAGEEAGAELKRQNAAAKRARMLRRDVGGES